MHETRKIEVNPWGSELVADYQELFDKFGLQRVSDSLRRKLSENRLFRRGIIFAHRDFDKFVAAAESGKHVAVMSGIKPSSEFHLGSKLTAEEIIFLQKRFGARAFYCVADEEALADNGIPLEESHANAVDNLADLLALGFDDKNAVVYKQSECLNVLRLAQEFSRRTTLATLESLYGHQNLALYLSVLIQAGDILQPQLKEFGGPKHVVVPVGIDQDPHIRFARDVAAKFSAERKFVLPSATFHQLFRALNGELKMSKRDPMNVLSLNDSPELVKQKIARVFTGGRATAEEQRRLGGEPDKCVLFELMKFHFLEDDADLKKMRDDCASGRVICGECKARYGEKIIAFLKRHQEKKRKARAKAEKILGKASV